MTEDTKQIEKVDARRRAYQACFSGEPGKAVLEDLTQFCRGMKSTFSRDPYEMAFREGRREVWLRIQSHLNITEDDIWSLFNREDNT